MREVKFNSGARTASGEKDSRFRTTLSTFRESTYVLALAALVGCGSPKTAPDAKDSAVSVQPGKAAKENSDIITARSSDETDAFAHFGQEDEISSGVFGNLRQLLRDLRSSDPEVMGYAVDEFLRIHEKAHSKLGGIVLEGRTPDELRQSSDFVTARRNVEDLEHIEDTRIIPILIERLSDDNAEIRRIAVRPFWCFRSAETTTALAKMLSDASPEVWMEALRSLHSIALSSYKDHIRAASDAVPALIEMLSSENIEVRQTAVFILGQISDVRALPALKEITNRADEDQMVRELARDAIGNLQPSNNQ